MVCRLIATLVLLFSFLSGAVAQESGNKSGNKPGQYIRHITIEIGEIFEGDDQSPPYSTVNSLKVNTHTEVVRRELLFKEGDPYNPFLIKETERNLRALRYLRAVKVTPVFDGDAVDIKVQARDTWTLIPYLSYSSGTGRQNRGIGLSESNLGGFGTRVEGRYQEQDSRQTFGAVVSDSRFLETPQRMLVSAFERSDGSIYNFEYGLPFRSLLQRDAWAFDATDGDTVGRLFKDGEENYIFRQRNDRFEALYTFAGPSKGSPLGSDSEEYSGIYKGQKLLSRRYSVGYAYQSDDFEQADAEDYKDLDLDPETVSNDPAGLAAPRLFSGPVLQYQTIQPNYISMNYIDRFDRVEDFNLGDELLIRAQLAPESLGSREDALLASGNRSRGWRFTEGAFLRGEVGGSSRFEDGNVANSLLRTEMKFYNVFGDWFVGERYLGRHTFASNFYIDFGEDLDKDRQLTLGADNALRGYKANSFEGDKRLVLNLEERAHLADDILQLVSLGTAVFLDVGGATRDSLGSILTEDLYGDVGFGFRLGFPRASGSGVVRIDVAFPLRDGPDGSGAFEPRIIFAAGQLFGAPLRSEVVGAENASVNVGFDR